MADANESRVAGLAADSSGVKAMRVPVLYVPAFLARIWPRGWTTMSRDALVCGKSRVGRR